MSITNAMHERVGNLLVNFDMTRTREGHHEHKRANYNEERFLLYSIVFKQFPAHIYDSSSKAELVLFTRSTAFVRIRQDRGCAGIYIFTVLESSGEIRCRDNKLGARTLYESFHVSGLCLESELRWEFLPCLIHKRVNHT